MASKALIKSWLSILGVAIVGGIQYSTLTQLSDGGREVIAQRHVPSAQLKSTQTSSTSVEQEVEQIKVMAKMPSLGFRNTLANYAFLQFLQYFGDDARQDVSYRNSAEYFSTVIRHDPYFRKFYVFLSGSSTLYAGMPEETVKIMSEGLASIGKERPADSYYIWRYKGTDELLFLNDGKAAQASFEMAADWALRTPGEEAKTIAEISQQTASFLAENPDSKAAQITAWGSILTTALDTRTRNRAIKEIRELGGDVVLTEDGQTQITLSEATADSDDTNI